MLTIRITSILGTRLTRRLDSYFIQIPVDLSEDAELAKKEEKGVKGRYVSVERLAELENGKVEWRMATSSSPGGSLPSFLVESTMAGQIAAVSSSRFVH